MAAPDKSSDPKKSPVSKFKRAILWVALACCLQFLVFGVVGVVRGYSIQSWVPVWILLVGVVLLAPFPGKHRMASLLSSSLLILYALVSISQGEHLKRGEALYEAGKYEEAMVAFHQEIDTWYLRLMFNYREAVSMFGIAKCHSRLAQFEEARDTYATMALQFRGYYRDRAKKEQADLEANLAEIRDTGQRLAEAGTDQEKAGLHFDLALVYRKLTCTKKAIEHYEAIESLEVPEPFKKQARRFTDELR